MPELPPRDALAHALDVRNKEKKKQKAAATAAQRRAVVARHTHAPGSVTPLMMSHMSPAAQAMAQRYVPLQAWCCCVHLALALNGFLIRAAAMPG